MAGETQSEKRILGFKTIENDSVSHLLNYLDKQGIKSEQLC